MNALIRGRVPLVAAVVCTLLTPAVLEAQYLQSTTSTTYLAPSQLESNAWGNRAPGLYPYNGGGVAGVNPLFTISGALDLDWEVANYGKATTRPTNAIIRCYLCRDGNCSNPIGPAAHIFDISDLQAGVVPFEARFDALSPGIEPSTVVGYRCSLHFASDEAASMLRIPAPYSYNPWWATTPATSPPVVVLGGPIG